MDEEEDQHLFLKQHPESKWGLCLVLNELKKHHKHQA